MATCCCRVADVAAVTVGCCCCRCCCRWRWLSGAILCRCSDCWLSTVSQCARISNAMRWHLAHTHISNTGNSSNTSNSSNTGRLQMRHGPHPRVAPTADSLLTVFVVHASNSFYAAAARSSNFPFAVAAVVAAAAAVTSLLHFTSQKCQAKRRPLTCERRQCCQDIQREAPETSLWQVTVKLMLLLFLLLLLLVLLLQLPLLLPSNVIHFACACNVFKRIYYVN